MIDIGLNLSSDRFDRDREAVLDRAYTAGLTHAICTGSSLEDSQKTLELCHQFEGHRLGLSATVGIHPHCADQVDDDSCLQLATLAESPKVVAMGEMGLDFFRTIQPPKLQEDAFERQLELAANNGKPVFLHQRDAHFSLYPILKHWRHRLNKVVVHCFTDNRQALYDYLDLDAFIGITGWVCDERRGQPLQALIAAIPQQRLMIETDAPYLLPRTKLPRPKNNRNEPSFLPYVLHQVALCYQCDQAQVQEAVTANARKFFGI